MISKEPRRLRWIAAGVGIGVIIPLWEAWPIIHLSGLQVWGFIGMLFGGALAGAVVAALGWRALDESFFKRN